MIDKSSLATQLPILIRADIIDMTRPRGREINRDKMTLDLAAFFFMGESFAE